MKKFLALALAFSSFLTQVSATSFFESSYEFPNNCEISHGFPSYSSCLHLKNGETLLSYEENDLKYTKIDLDGKSTVFYTDYKIIGEDDFSHLIISHEVQVFSDDFDDFITVTKYGLLNSDFSLLLEPILDNYSIYDSYFVADFDNYGIAKVYYGAENYSYEDKFLAAFNVLTPTDAKQAFLTSNGELITDFDEVYCDFATENRYLVKKDDVFSLVDSNLNVIATDFYGIIELDFGKFVIAQNTNNSTPIYTASIDQNGEKLNNFDVSNNELISDWAKNYIYYTPYTISYSFTQTFDDLDQNFYTQNITRLGFCKLITNFLQSKEYDFPEISDFSAFSDTKDDDVLIVQKLGLINGTDVDTFSPYENLTREQAAAILYRLCQLLEIPTDEKTEISQFSDFSQFSDYSKEAILSLSALDSFDGYHVLSGVSDDVFSPNSNFTLEQALIALLRLFYI